MDNWTIREELPSVEEYNELRRAAGWQAFPRRQCESGLQASLFCVCVRQQERIVGMGRIVGDGAIYFYLQDVVVRPECRGQGVGRAIVDRLLELLRRHAPGMPIRLMAAPGSARFYENLGFKRRAEDRPGMQWDG